MLINRCELSHLVHLRLPVAKLLQQHVKDDQDGDHEDQEVARLPAYPHLVAQALPHVLDVDERVLRRLSRKVP